MKKLLFFFIIITILIGIIFYKKEKVSIFIPSQKVLLKNTDINKRKVIKEKQQKKMFDATSKEYSIEHNNTLFRKDIVKQQEQSIINKIKTIEQIHRYEQIQKDIAYKEYIKYKKNKEYKKRFLMMHKNISKKVLIKEEEKRKNKERSFFIKHIENKNRYNAIKESKDEKK